MLSSRGLARSLDKQDHHTPLTRVCMATKLGRVITDLDGLLPVKAHDPLIIWLYEITWQTKTIISPIPQSLWTPKQGRIVTYLKQLPPIKLLVPFITWSC